MKALPYKTENVLLLINGAHCRALAAGFADGGSFLPSAYPQTVSTLRGEYWIQGGGDAARFRHLEKLGLIRMEPNSPLGNKYVSRVTDAGIEMARLILLRDAWCPALPPPADVNDFEFTAKGAG